MLKNEILDLISKFEIETWKYDSNDKLDNDMQYIYSIEKELKDAKGTNLNSIYDRLKSLIGIIRCKYGFASIIINKNPELENLKRLIDDISLNSDDIINQYNYISTVYNNFIIRNKNMDFIENKYTNIQGKEGLCLAIESLKTLITNEEYRQLLDINQINEVLIDCVKLNNGRVNIKNIESKYKEIIKKIWKNSLTNSPDNNGKFRFLFSNISGGDLREKANILINRPNQASCSMISSNFIAIYGSDTRRIGFIYPRNSEIVMASAYDLNSNVFGIGSKNKEKGTLVVTPEALERCGIMLANQQGDDLYSASCYNEVLVNSKPCGIVILGLGENDLNVDYQEAKMLSLEMDLPIYYIDTMKYKDKLSEADKNYIAFHSILTYLNIISTDISQTYLNNDYIDIYKLINIYKEQIAEIFLDFKKTGNLSKENMCQAISNLIDFSKTNGKISNYI